MTEAKPTRDEQLEIKIPMSELRKRSLFLGTPCYGGQCTAMFARSVADLSAQCAQLGIALQIYFLMNESLIPRARNYVCDEFMRGSATHMVFIDADIHFDARDVVAMMAMMGDDTPYDIMAAPYPKKTISWEKIKQAVDRGFADKDPNVLDRFVGDFVFNPLPGTQSFRVDKPVEVLEAGTGFMMFRRRTFEQFRDAYPEYWYRPDHVRSEHFDGSREVFMYFQAEIDQIDYGKELKRRLLDMMQDGDLSSEDWQRRIENVLSELDALNAKKSKRYLSEDYWHNQKARAIGLRTWLCPWMKTTHTGTYNFGGSLADLAALGASATADVNLLKKGVKK